MTITALPTAPSRTQDADTFNTNADAWVAALPTFVTEANALETNVNAKEAATNADAIATAADRVQTGLDAYATAADAIATAADRVQTGLDRAAAEAAAATATEAAAFVDTNPIVKGSVDDTKRVRIEVDTNVPTGTTVVLTAPSSNVTLAGLEKQQAFTKPQRPSLSSETAPSSNTVTWDLTTDSVFRINLNANITTFNLTGTLADLAGYQYRANIRFNGGTTVSWHASVKWAGGTAPTLTGTSGKLDIFTFEVATTNGTDYYLCEIGRTQNVG